MIICRSCREWSEDTILKWSKNGTHLGLYCSKCGAWIKWVGKDSYLYPQAPEKPAVEESQRGLF